MAGPTPNKKRKLEKAKADPSTPVPVAPLPPSVEASYRSKCIALKRRLAEVEAANDEARIRISRSRHGIQKARLERAILMDRIQIMMSYKRADSSEGSPSPPHTPKEKPLRHRRAHGSRKGNSQIDRPSSPIEPEQAPTPPSNGLQDHFPDEDIPMANGSSSHGPPPAKKAKKGLRPLLPQTNKVSATPPTPKSARDAKLNTIYRTPRDDSSSTPKDEERLKRSSARVENMLASDEPDHQPTSHKRHLSDQREERSSRPKSAKREPRVDSQSESPEKTREADRMYDFTKPTKGARSPGGRMQSSPAEAIQHSPPMEDPRRIRTASYESHHSPRLPSIPHSSESRSILNEPQHFLMARNDTHSFAPVDHPSFAAGSNGITPYGSNYTPPAAPLSTHSSFGHTSTPSQLPSLANLVNPSSSVTSGLSHGFPAPASLQPPPSNSILNHSQMPPIYQPPQHLGAPASIGSPSQGSVVPPYQTLQSSLGPVGHRVAPSYSQMSPHALSQSTVETSSPQQIRRLLPGKRRNNAFEIFAAHFREHIISSNSHPVADEEINDMAAQTWQGYSADEKKPYQEKFEEEKAIGRAGKAGGKGGARKSEDVDGVNVGAGIGEFRQTVSQEDGTVNGGNGVDGGFSSDEFGIAQTLQAMGGGGARNDAQDGDVELRDRSSPGQP